MFHVTRPFSVRFIILLAFGVGLISGAAAQQAPKTEYSTAHRDASISLPQTITGPAKLAARLKAQRSAISVATTSFHRNGTKDLLTGYATSTGGALVLQSGAPEALAPTAAEMPALIAGHIVMPFRQLGNATELPVRPDLLLAGNFRGNGSGDVLTAQRGDRSVYFLAGDGNGGFATPQQFALRGNVSALGTWRHPDGDLLLVAAVNGGKGASGLQLLTLKGEEKSFVPFEGSATSIESVYLNNASLQDLVFVVGGQATVLDGDSILNGSPAFDFIGPSNAVAVAPGRFVWDKRGFMQVAVLTSDATLRIFARPGLDASDLTPEERLANRKASVSPHERIAPPRLLDAGWNEVETTGGIGAGYDAKAVLLHGRFTAGGMEDLLVLTRGSTYEVAHPMKTLGVMQTTPAFITVDSTPAPVVAVVAARLSADSRLGFVTAGGGIQPYVTVPPTRTTYYVNLSSDTYHSPTNCTISNNTTCSLRDALAATAANRQTGTPSSVDTIIVAASTTLATQNNYIDQQGDINYHFNVETSVNIVGSQACTHNSAGVATACPIVIDGANKDIIFAINSSSTSASGDTFSPYAVFMSNLQLQNGVNNNNGGGAASGAYTALLGGLIYGDVDGTGSFTCNSMVLNGGTVNYGYNGFGGGALGFFNNFAGSQVGSVEIDNSTLSNNTVTPASTGGGVLALATDINLFATNNIWSGNSSNMSGGAIYENQSQLANASNITGNVFTRNTALGDGGAITYASAITISNTTFTGNSVTSNIESNFGGGGGGGGGVSMFTDDGAVNITYSTFTGNTVSSSASVGAGMLLQGTSASGTVYPYNVSYSRIHGNTGGVANTQGLSTGNPTQTGGGGRTVYTATNNWWGCNADPQSHTSPCDGAQYYAYFAQSLTTSPYTTLTFGISSTTPAYNTTLTATASLGQNSSGTVYTATQDYAYLATPITTFTLTNTGFVTYNPSSTAFSSSAATGTSNAAATASGTTNATGNGTATLTVDGVTLTKTYTISAPDLTVSSTHTGNFKAGDTADTYSLTVANIGNSSTSGSVTVTDSLPSGFTATAISGSGWTCTLSSLSCTRSDTLSASVSYPTITLTFSISSSDAGTYTNSATVSGGGEINTNNDTGTNSTIVIGAPTIAEAFNPASVAPNVNSYVTFTLVNPGGNVVSLTGVAFTDTLPTGLKVSTPSNPSTTCNLATVTATAGSSSIALSGANIAAGAMCTVTVNVDSASSGSYPNPTGNVSATNSNAGGTASATLTVTLAAPTVSASFSPATVVSDGTNASTSSLTIVLTNSNSTTITGVAFTDMFPNQIQILSPPAPSCGGTINSSANTVTFSGGTIATNSSCSITVSVIAAVATGTTGTYTDSTGTVTASNAPSGTAATASLTVSATPTKLVYTASPATPIIAGGNAGTFTVTLENPSGSIATTYSTTVVTVTVTGPSSYSQSYTATSSSGVATFNLSSVPVTGAGSYTYTASATSLTSAVAVETVNPGTPTTLAVAGLGPFAAPGIAGTATVTATDTYGNTATGFTGTVTLTSTDSTASISPASYTYMASDNATHNFTVTFNTAGTFNVIAKSGSFTGSQTNILVEDAIWILNNDSTLARLTDAGVQTGTAGTSSNVSSSGGVAFDHAGDVWVANQAAGAVQEYTKAGVAITVSGSSAAGVSAPTSLFIDGAGQVWVANGGTNSISVLTNAGAAVSPSTGYESGALSNPSSIVVDSSGSIWVTNSGNNSVTKIIGGAIPVVAPIAAGTATNTLGTQP